MYEQPELPDWVTQLQNDVEDYKAALLRIAQTPRNHDGKCLFCSSTTTPLGGGFVRNTPHAENCPVGIAEKALS